MRYFLRTLSCILVPLSSIALANPIPNDSTLTTSNDDFGHVSHSISSDINVASRDGFEVTGRSRHSDSPDPLESVSSKSTPTAPSTDPPFITTNARKILYKRTPLQQRWESVINRHSFVNSHLPLVGGGREAMRVVLDAQRQTKEDSG